MTRFCKDCDFYGGYVGTENVCTEPRNKRLDLVTGKMTRTDASWLRNLKDEDKCGPDGKWWMEAKLRVVIRDRV